MVPFHGQQLPARFGDAIDEWHAAGEGCGVFDASFRSFIHVTGSDRVSFLQGMLSNDVKSLAAGHGLHAAFLTQQAKLVSDLRVYADPDRLTLDALTWRADTLVEGLDRYLIADDVELIRPTDDVPLLGLEGASASAVVGKVFGDDAVCGGRYRHRKSRYAGVDLRIFEVSEVGGSGFLLSGPNVAAASLFEALCGAGAIPIGMDALNVLRVERGIPWVGIDMDEDVLLMEVGLDDAVSFNKGCYLGQEVVERVSARGHVNRRLTGLLLEGDDVAAPGSTVFAAGAEVGWTVSSVVSFALQRPIALAYLRREVLEPGSRVQVSSGERQIDATVQALPFSPGVG
jgi:folate-binding protein YgfZ